MTNDILNLFSTIIVYNFLNPITKCKPINIYIPQSVMLLGIENAFPELTKINSVIPDKSIEINTNIKIF